MRILPLSEVKAKLSGLVKELEITQEEIFITKQGRAAAVLVSAEEYESWKETSAIKADKDLMRQIRASQKKGYKTRTYTRAELDKLFQN